MQRKKIFEVYSKVVWKVTGFQMLHLHQNVVKDRFLFLVPKYWSWNWNSGSTTTYHLPGHRQLMCQGITFFKQALKKREKWPWKQLDGQLQSDSLAHSFQLLKYKIDECFIGTKHKVFMRVSRNENTEEESNLLLQRCLQKRTLRGQRVVWFSSIFTVDLVTTSIVWRAIWKGWRLDGKRHATLLVLVSRRLKTWSYTSDRNVRGQSGNSGDDVGVALSSCFSTVCDIFRKWQVSMAALTF